MKATPNFLDYLQQLSSSPADDPKDYKYYSSNNPALSTFLNLSSSFAYILDYRGGKYLYLSNSIQEILNYPFKTVKEGGLDLMLNLCKRSDLDVINTKVFRDNCKYLNTLDTTKLGSVRFTLNYRCLTAKGSYVSLRQSSQVLKTDSNSNPLVSCGICALVPPHTTPFNITHAIQHLNDLGQWQNETINHYFPDRNEETLLSKRELEILKWILEGYSNPSIAEKLNRSLHTVKTHRKNILEKTHTKNTADLLRYGIINGLV